MDKGLGTSLEEGKLVGEDLGPSASKMLLLLPGSQSVSTTEGKACSTCLKSPCSLMALLEKSGFVMVGTGVGGSSSRSLQTSPVVLPPDILCAVLILNLLFLKASSSA